MSTFFLLLLFFSFISSLFLIWRRRLPRPAITAAATALLPPRAMPSLLGGDGTAASPAVRPGQPVRSSDAAVVLAGRLPDALPSLVGLAASADLGLAHCLSMAVDKVLAKYGLTKAGAPPGLGGGGLFLAVALPAAGAAFQAATPCPAPAGEVGDLATRSSSEVSSSSGDDSEAADFGLQPPHAPTLAAPGTAHFPTHWSPAEAALVAVLRCSTDMHAALAEVSLSRGVGAGRALSLLRQKALILDAHNPSPIHSAHPPLRRARPDPDGGGHGYRMRRPGGAGVHAGLPVSQSGRDKREPNALTTRACARIPLTIPSILSSLTGPPLEIARILADAAPPGGTLVSEAAIPMVRALVHGAGGDGVAVTGAAGDDDPLPLQCGSSLRPAPPGRLQASRDGSPFPAWAMLSGADLAAGGGVKPAAGDGEGSGGGLLPPSAGVAAAAAGGAGGGDCGAAARAAAMPAPAAVNAGRAAGLP